LKGKNGSLKTELKNSEISCENLREIKKELYQRIREMKQVYQQSLQEIKLKKNSLALKHYELSDEKLEDNDKFNNSLQQNLLLLLEELDNHNDDLSQIISGIPELNHLSLDSSVGEVISTLEELINKPPITITK